MGLLECESPETSLCFALAGLSANVKEKMQVQPQERKKKQKCEPAYGADHSAGDNVCECRKSLTACLSASQASPDRNRGSQFVVPVGARHAQSTQQRRKKQVAT